MGKKIYSVGSPVDEDLYDVSAAKLIYIAEMHGDFDQALLEGEYEVAMNIINALKGEGFEKEAYELHKLLQEEKVFNFKA